MINTETAFLFVIVSFQLKKENTAPSRIFPDFGHRPISDKSLLAVLVVMFVTSVGLVSNHLQVGAQDRHVLMCRS